MRDMNPLTKLNWKPASLKVDEYKGIAHRRAVFTGIAQALASIQQAEEFAPYADSPPLECELDASALGRSLMACNKSLEEMHHDIATLTNDGIHPSSAIWCGYNWGVLMLDRPLMIDQTFIPYVGMFTIPPFKYFDGVLTEL